MQVLERLVKHDPIQQLWNILNLKALPYFDPTKIIKNQIRGLSEFDKLLESIIKKRDLARPEDDESPTNQHRINEEDQVNQFTDAIQKDIDTRADPIMIQLSETCDEALEAYKSWRSPRFVGRFKIDGKIEEQMDTFAKVRTKVFARDIGRCVDRLISLGVDARHFYISSMDYIKHISVKRSYSDIITEIEKADTTKAPELLSELITCVKVILPVNQKYDEVHYISPSMAEVANVKEQTA